MAFTATYHGSIELFHGPLTNVTVDAVATERFGETRFRGITEDGELLRQISPASLTFAAEDEAWPS